MKKLLIITIVILLARGAFAVSGVATDPSRIMLNPRQLGTGGAAIGFSDDANGIFSNPSGMTGFEFPQLTASSRNIMLDETKYTSMGWVMPTNYGNIGLGYVAMGTGGSIPTIRDPATGRITQDPSAEVSSYSNSVTALTYCREVNPALKLSVGGNLKIFNQALSGGGVSDRGNATNLDLAVTASPLRWLTAGIVLQNLLGGAVKWGSTEDKLGGYYKIGGKANLLGAKESSLVANPHNVVMGLDLDLPNKVLASSNSLLYHLGFEYSPHKDIAIRAGLNQEVAGSVPTFGVGLTNSGFRFDYAYMQRAGIPGDNPHYFSLSYIGERIVTSSLKLKRKEVQVKFSEPKDRLITDLDAVALSAEARALRVYDQKTIWTVISISDTVEVREISEVENLKPVYLNGTELKQAGTIEMTMPLRSGRNVFQLFGYSTPEVFAKKATPEVVSGSAEVRVLRFTPFSDTPMHHWAIEPIAVSVTLELIKGYPNNVFKPEKGITRAELVTLLVRSLGVPEATLELHASAEAFEDVKETNWSAKFVNYGSALKLVTGYKEGTFKPNKVLNRAEGVTILARYAGLSEEAVAIAPFPDLKPEFWANKFIEPAKKAGLLKYLSGKDFEPNAEFTRAEACEVLYQTPEIKKKVELFWNTGFISAQK